MAKAPTNSQRRTLSKQSLVSQTNSKPDSASATIGFLATVNLDIPVHGLPTGLVVMGSTAAAVVTASVVVVISPTQLTAQFAAAPKAVWVSNSGGLKTASNGIISPEPVAVL